MTDQTTIPYGLGYLRDVPDIRDWHFTAPAPVLAQLPPSVDLTPTLGPVLNQEQLGSCVSNATDGALMCLEQRQFGTFTPASRLFIYYEGRKLENTLQSDSGLQIRDAVKVVNQVGAPPEADWPYDITKFRNRPPAKAYADAKRHRTVAYQRVAQDLQQMQAALAGGYPVLVGFAVYQSMVTPEVAQSGMIPLPHQGEQQLGGHCVLLTGYDMATGLWKIRNSWSEQWGQAGNAFMPFAYLLNPGLAGDFWVIAQTN